jgi:hypothetical protein
MVWLQARLECGPTCPWHLGAWVLATSGPILCHPSLQWCPEAVVEPIAGPTYELLGLIGLRECFWLRSLLTCDDCGSLGS